MIPDRWYPILDSTRLNRRPVAATRMGQRWALWRDSAGTAHALPALCPHRGADLAQGRVRGGELECPWHGFRFAGDGRCTLAPCLGPGTHVPDTLHLEAPAVAERHGLIWLWWGQGVPTREPPWFDDDPLDDSCTWQAARVLPYHYTRMIEVNLDVHHTPFVHGSVMPGIGSRVQNFEAHLDGDTIRTSGEMARQDGSRPFPFRADAILPNLVLIALTPSLKIVIAATPVDKVSTWVWFRYYQSYTRVPGLRRALPWLAVMSELWVVQRQDWRIFARMAPGTIDDVDYHLVAPDRGIALYRRRRRELLSMADGHV